LAKIKENKRKINSLTYPQIRIHGGWFETELIRAQKDSSSIAPVSLLEKTFSFSTNWGDQSFVNNKLDPYLETLSLGGGVVAAQADW